MMICREISGRHCEERSDEAIQPPPRLGALDCFAALAMTAWARTP
jgi:integrase/recombinase XerC